MRHTKIYISIDNLIYDIYGRSGVSNGPYAEVRKETKQVNIISGLL